MAQTALTKTSVVRAGISCADAALTAADVANGNKFTNSIGRSFILARNSGVTTRTVTVDCPATVDGLAVADLTVSLTSGAEKLIGPFTANFHQPSVTNIVYVSADHAEVLFGIFDIA